MMSVPSEDKKKRERGKNFSERDKSELTRLVQKYANIIECKKTDGTSLKKKNEAWEVVTHQFNATAEQPRSMANLKIFYQNLKRKVRVDVAESHKRKYLQDKQEEQELEIKKLIKQAANDKNELFKTKQKKTTKSKVYKLSTSQVKRQYFLTKLKSARLELIYRRKQIRYLDEKARRENIKV